MKFPRDFLQAIKDRLTLSDVIGQRVALKRAGRELKGCCPFHDETTPSFHVNDAKGVYHCFGCGAKGDVIDFVMAHDHLPFPDTVKMLAAQADVSLPGQSPKARQAEQQREKLFSVLDDAAQWFHEQLANPAHRHALSYLAARGVRADQIETFHLGYAPADGRLLRRYLRQQGHGYADMVAAGVMKRSAMSDTVYCAFRDRIMFPVTDRRSRTIAFGGRILPDELRAQDQRGRSPPKYLNSSETLLFHKGRMLYGEPQARAGVGQSGPLIVVEGYTDVLACHKAEFAAVAPLGTALSEAQLLLLWQMTPATEKVPVLCFDGDAAGTRAARHACEAILPLLKPRHSMRFAFLPAGADPDTLVANKGRAGFQEVLDRALPLDQYLWHLHTASQTFETPEERAGLEADLHRAIDAIGDESVRHYYRQAFDDRLRHFFSARSAPGLQEPFASALMPGPR